MRQSRVPADVRLETQRRTTARGMRSPTFDLRSTTFKAQTLHVLGYNQVLPGDTLKNASVQARVVGAPTSTAEAAIQGWWYEHFLFYVRVGDLPTYAEAMRNAIANIASSGTPSAAELKADINSAIWTGYFVDEGESIATANRMRWAGVDFLDSATPVTELSGSDTITDDWDDQWLKYQSMRRAKLTTNTFEEWLAKQGIAVPPQLRNENDPELKKPELLHFSREFAYPQPTTNPSGATLAHAVQWFIQDRTTRARFFAEPGWIVPCLAFRPKVYLSGPSSPDPMSWMADDAQWFPPEFDTDPHTSLTQVAGGALYASDGTNPFASALVVDRRDLLINGYSYSPTSQKYYRDRRPTQAEIDALPTFACDYHARYQIASRVSKDTTF